VAGIGFSLALKTILEPSAKGNPDDPTILLAGVLLLSFVSVIACAINSLARLPSRSHDGAA